MKFTASKAPAASTASGAMGSHCILELTGCPAEILSDENRIRDAIAQASEKSLSTLLHVQSHGFGEDGVTALGLLAESHISIHTWPELGYAACDIFTSGGATKPTQGCDFLTVYLQAKSASLKVVPRGRRAALARKATAPRPAPCPAH